MEKQELSIYSVNNGVTGFVGNFKINGSYVVNGFINLDLSVKDYLMSVSSEEKMNASLRMVQFDGNIDELINEFGPMDRKKIELAYALCKKDKYIYLDYFEKGLNYKEKMFFKKLINKLKEYQISTIVHTNDINFLVDVVDKICIVENNKVIKELHKNDWYNDLLYNYVDRPEIISFIKYCQDNGIAIENYLDNKEVIKAIFRLVS